MWAQSCGGGHWPTVTRFASPCRSEVFNRHYFHSPPVVGSCYKHGFLPLGSHDASWNEPGLVHSRVWSKDPKLDQPPTASLQMSQERPQPGHAECNHPSEPESPATMALQTHRSLDLKKAENGHHVCLPWRMLFLGKSNRDSRENIRQPGCLKC